jgi:hypothetical protein
MPLDELGFPTDKDEREDDDGPRRELLTLSTAGLVGRGDGNYPGPIEPEPEGIGRRQLLQALGTLGIAWSPAVQALHQIQTSVEYTLGHDDGAHLDEWEDIVAEYGYTYALRPAHLLLPDVASDLVTVRTIMSRIRASDSLFPSWCRVTSGLAVLMAKLLADLGERREARMWWVTAQQSADLSRDSDLSLWVGAERLVYGMYEHRPTPILLRKAEQMTQRAPTTACRGLVHLRTIHAQLLALDGHDKGARAELQRSRDVFEQLPATITADIRSLAGWGEYRLRYTEAWVYAYLAEPDRVDEAVARGHFLQPSLCGGTQLSLLQAFGHVQKGDLSNGVQHAVTTYASHPVDHRTVMVNSLAELVLEAVPPRKRNDPAVSGYRELVTSRPQRKAIT